MTGAAGILIAAILPLVLGYAWLGKLWKEAHPAARIGYGYLLGVLVVATVLLLTGRMAGYSMEFEHLAFFFTGLTLMALLVPPSASESRSVIWKGAGGDDWQRWIWWFLALILAVRYGGLVLEVVLRPLFPWDAWMNWAPKAKTWFSLKELVPFVSPDQWSGQSISEGARTLGNPEAVSYPPLVPLIQTWSALGLGAWRDNWINVPWAMCALAFFLAFYGQLRMFGFSPLAAMVPSYLLFSTPCLDTHVALAGYADLWMAAFYTAALMAFASWSVTGSRMQFLLLLLMGIACIMTKKPGSVWALTLIPGILLVVLPVKLRHVILGGMVAVFIGMWINGGFYLSWDGEPLLVLNKEHMAISDVLRYELEYHPVGEYFLKNILYRDNWHLLGWIMVFLLPWALVRSVLATRFLPLAVVVLLGLLFILGVFFFTEYYRFAVDSTTINRAIFHVMPSLVYFISIILGHAFPKGRRADKGFVLWKDGMSPEGRV